MASLVLWALGSWAHEQLLQVLTAPWDKLVHIAVFTGIALVVGGLLGVRRPRDLWRCFALALLFGVVDEGLQWFDAARTLDAEDLLANAVGALMGTALHAAGWAWRRRGRGHEEDSGFTRR